MRLLTLLLIYLSPSLGCNFTNMECGYDTNGDIYQPLLGCSIICCQQIRDAEQNNNCSSDPDFVNWKAKHLQWQSTNCSLFVCDDPCLDPLAPVLGSTSGGALNKAFNACGVTTDMNNIGEEACNDTCCSAMATAFSACNSSSSKIKYTTFDTLLTGYQLFKCSKGFTCYPNDKCFDPLGFINNNRGAINRGLATCGVPDLTDITVDLDWSSVVKNTDMACNASCCTALHNAAVFCSNDSSSSKEYDIVSTVFPAWQALHCENFTCNPPKCFDYNGLINSNLGAANRVIKACGALSDLKTIFDNVNNWDPYKACRPSCCTAIEAARPYCNNSNDVDSFNTLIDIIYAYQAGYCNTSDTDPYGGPFMCKPNDQCFDKFGIVNAKIGAATRASHACGFKFSLREDSTKEILDNQMGFNSTGACSTTCCNEMDAAIQCNDSLTFDAFDVSLTAYQLFKCPSGFTCIPDNKCADPLGIINSERGFLNRAYRACGVPDIKGILFDPSSIPTNLNQSCGESCCLAVENARSHCKDDPLFNAFELALPAWQAKWCTDFTCTKECFSTVGLINSRIGAANRVLRYCGVPSEFTDISSLVQGSFDYNLVCQNICCQVINEAVPFCQNETSFSNLLDLIHLVQAKKCTNITCSGIGNEGGRPLVGGTILLIVILSCLLQGCK